MGWIQHLHRASQCTIPNLSVCLWMLLYWFHQLNASTLFLWVDISNDGFWLKRCGCRRSHFIWEGLKSIERFTGFWLNCAFSRRIVPCKRTLCHSSTIRNWDSTLVRGNTREAFMEDPASISRSPMGSANGRPVNFILMVIRPFQFSPTVSYPRLTPSQVKSLWSRISTKFGSWTVPMWVWADDLTKTLAITQ